MLSVINFGLRVFLGSLAGAIRVAPWYIGYYLKGMGPAKYIGTNNELGATLLKNDDGIADHKHFTDVTITTNNDGVRLHAVMDAGQRRQKGKRPIIFVHGFPELWVSYHNQLEYFASRGHPVLAIDMRGYGLSDKPRGIDRYNMNTYLVNDIRCVVEYATRELGGDGRLKPLLVAHDWGASVCWTYVCQNRTVMNGEVVGYVSLTMPPMRAFKDNMSIKQAWMSLYMVYFNMPWVPEKVFLANDAWFIGAIMKDCKRATLPEWLVGAYRANVLQPKAMESQLNYYRSAIQQAPKPAEDVRGTKSNRLPLPVLIMRGLDDNVLGDDLFKGLDEYLSDVKLVEVENCSHWMQADCPDEVNTEIEGFLGRFD